MAVIRIVVKDNPDGTVSIASDPPEGSIVMMMQNGGATSAHGYALRMMTAAGEMSKGKPAKSSLVLPNTLN